MKSQEEKIFLKKYWTHYFVYGYLSFIAAVLFCVIGFVLKAVLPENWIRIFLFVWFLLSGASFIVLFIKIAVTTKTKFKFYKVCSYVLKTRGSDSDFYEPYLQMLCYKVIIKDLCKVHKIDFKKILLFSNKDQVSF